MKLFVVLTYFLCDDPYYGYNEYLHSVYDTFANAQVKTNSLLQEQANVYDGIDGYVTIVEMTLGGDPTRTELFSSRKPRPKKKVQIYG